MHQFVSQREFPVEPEILFNAIEDKEKLAKWWGPEGFSCKFDIFEFKEDGRWIFTMIGPDGKEYPNENRFISISKPDEVIIRHDGMPYFTVTLTIERTDTGSILNFLQVFDDPELLEKILPVIKPANEQVLNKLEEILR